MRMPLYMLALPRAEEEARRCCDDRVVRTRAVTRSWPSRWTRKIATSVPMSLRVFRRSMAAPLTPPIETGTPVVSSTGRSLGVVRSVVVQVESGGPAYAVGPRDGDAQVVLLPRHTVAIEAHAAVVDERVLRALELQSA